MKNKIIYVKNKISRVILTPFFFVNLWSLVLKRNIFCNLLSMILSNLVIFYLSFKQK